MNKKNIILIIIIILLAINIFIKNNKHSLINLNTKRMKKKLLTLINC